jgi:internalin A
MAYKLPKNLEGSYKLRLSWRYDKVEFLGLPYLKENRPLTLGELYVPLSFNWVIGSEEKPFYLPKALTESHHLVVLGDPGCGKSMLVKVITYLFGRTETSSLRQRFGPLLPVPIILRDYNVRNWRNYEDMLRDFIGQLDQDIRDHITTEWLLGYLRSEREEKKAILLLDGIDEVGSQTDRKHLRDRIVRPLLEEMSGSYAVLTSRIVGYEEAPFDREAEYIQAKARILQPSLFAPRRCYVAPFDDNCIEQFIVHWYTAREQDSERRQEGIESLKRALNQNDRVKRLATNPLLLTLMALVHRITAQLPSGRTKLYDKIVEAYLETIDRSRKLKQYPASLEQMKRWLARVGWEMQSRRDKGQDTELLVARADIARWLTEAIEAEGRTSAAQEAEQFLDWVERRAGLLVERGSGQFSFVHLTFQEYFAAFYLRGQVRRFDRLAGQCAELILNAHWHEAICVLFEMLAEFPGASDDLLDELKNRAGKTEKNSFARRRTAELFSALLLDEENSLGNSKREVAARFALDLATGDYNQTVVENLKKFPPVRFDAFVSKWFDQQLKERSANQFGKYLFPAGAALLDDWPQRLRNWIVSPNYSQPSNHQVAVIALIGARDVEVYRQICPWAIEHLPLQFWLRQICLGSGYGQGSTLADVYRRELYATLTNVAKHRLLVESSIASAITKSQLLRTAVALFACEPDSDFDHDFNSELARELDRALNRNLDRDLDRALDRDLEPDLEPVLARALNRILDRDLARAAARVLARVLARDANFYLADPLGLAMQSPPLEIPTKNAAITFRLAQAEWIFFAPDIFNSEAPEIISQLQKLVTATDDWRQLIAISALLTFGEGSPELCNKRNALLDKGIKQSSKFTFPADLHPETETDRFRKQLPETLDLIFLYDPNDPWLKPELFDPSRPESKYFLSKPREFFILAAEVLDPEGETELSEWRKRLAGSE